MKQAVLDIAKKLGGFELARRANRRSLRILCYHGLWTSPGEPFGECLFMPVPQFEARMAWLAASQYQVLDLDDAVMRLANDTLPENSVVITIDDGWRSTFTDMAPILKKYGLPATLYVSTYYVQRQAIVVNIVVRFILERTTLSTIQTPAFAQSIAGAYLLTGNANDRTQAAKIINSLIDDIPALDARVAAVFDLAEAAKVGLDDFEDQFYYVSGDELLQMHKDGMRIELHTHRHQSVNKASTDLHREIQDNREALISFGLSGPFKHFCYPSGDTAQGVAATLSRLSVLSATTTSRRVNSPKYNPFYLGRLLDGHRVLQLDFEAYLSGLI